MDNLTLGYLTLDIAPADTVTAAAEAGWKSVGIRITGRRRSDPYTQVVGNAAEIADIRRRIGDSGIRLSNISAYHFYPDVTLSDLERVLDTTAQLGADTCVANCYIEDEAAFIDFFARYCEMASAFSIRIALEFMRYSSVKTLAQASRIVERTGQANAGILIDPLHLSRSGGTAADIAGADPSRVFFVQLCDAAAEPPADLNGLRIEARTGRLFPADGSLKLDDFLDALPPGTEIEIEVPRAEHAHRPAAERARIAVEATERFFAARRARRPR